MSKYDFRAEQDAIHEKRPLTIPCTRSPFADADERRWESLQHIDRMRGEREDRCDSMLEIINQMLINECKRRMKNGDI